MQPPLELERRPGHGCSTVAQDSSDRPWHYVDWRARAATSASKCVPNWQCCQTDGAPHAIAGFGLWNAVRNVCLTSSHFSRGNIHLQQKTDHENVFTAAYWIKCKCMTRAMLWRKEQEAEALKTSSVLWWNLGGCPYQWLACQPSLLARRSRSITWSKRHRSTRKHCWPDRDQVPFERTAWSCCWCCLV